MRFLKSTAIILATLTIVMLSPAIAEVVYTPVNVSIPVNGSFYIDLDHDGVPDFTLRSHVLQDYCQFGDGYAWNLSVTPASGNGVMAADGYYADGLIQHRPVDSSQTFFSSTAILAELDWGYCGRGLYGEWLNLPNRYLGLSFRVAGDPDVHYGWAKVSEVAYVDQDWHLHTSTILQGFAYETIPGRGILTGQTAGEAEQ